MFRIGMLLASAILNVFIMTGAVAPNPALATVINHCGNGSITASETWAGDGTIHNVTCSMTVASGVTLTISAGAIVKFARDASLNINGTLQATGAEGNSVVFTSYRDDSAGGDTNNDGPTSGQPEDWASIMFSSVSDKANSFIDHAEVRYAGGWHAGVLSGGVTLNDASPAVRNTIFTGNSYCAVYATVGSVPVLNQNTYTNNEINALCLKSGFISKNSTWNITDTSYYLDGDISISVNTALTISPGVVVKFARDSSLIIGGKLRAVGTADQKIVFTSYRDDSVQNDTNNDGPSTGQIGDWARIEFTALSDSANSLIDYAEIRYGGGWHGGVLSGGLTLTDSSPTVQNTAFTYNQFCAVKASPKSQPVFNNNTFANNTINAYCINGGTVDKATTWNITNTSYFLNVDVSVSVNTTLTISPGVVVKFGRDAGLVVGGGLQALGTTASPITFTSYQDDSVQNDTNNDGPSTGQIGDWAGISFTPLSASSQSTIDNAKIRYAGGWHSGVLFGAVTFDSASPAIKNSTITNSHVGMLSTTSTPVLGCNNIFDNEYGFQNQTPTSVVNAQNQWWGSPNGPNLDSDPQATQNKVTQGVNFTPWRNAPCNQENTNLNFFVYLPNLVR